MNGVALPVDALLLHLRRQLESWLQFRFGPRAVLTAIPLKVPAGRPSAEMAAFVWLEILADDIGAPSAVGIRQVPGYEQLYEIIEWAGPKSLQRHQWRLGSFSAWRRR